MGWTYMETKSRRRPGCQLARTGNGLPPLFTTYFLTDFHQVPRLPVRPEQRLVRLGVIGEADGFAIPMQFPVLPGGDVAEDRDDGGVDAGEVY